VSDAGLRDGFLVPDNVGNKFARAKSVSFWSVQTRSLVMNWSLEAMKDVWTRRWRRTARRVLRLG
jgi:hypothetical protein